MKNQGNSTNPITIVLT